MKRSELLGQLTANPSAHPCPRCGHVIRAWAHENTLTCDHCHLLFKKGSTRLSPFETILNTTKEMGASDAIILKPQQVEVNPELAELYNPSGCDFFGQCKNHPPHLTTPEEFQVMLDHARAVLVFRVDMPNNLFMCSDRRVCFQILHELAANIENCASENGYPGSSAYAGGSCRDIFCPHEISCDVIDKNRPCRYPDKARPSISGCGVDVVKLMAISGWSEVHREMRMQEMACVCGLVLLA